MTAATIPKRLTVIADFHMSAPAYDDFVEDRAAAAFLDHLAAQPTNRSLLILGDLIDFAKVPLGRRRLDTSSQAALRKLDVVAAEHEPVFAALGRLADAGVALELVAGNHDAELVRPPVQKQLGRLLGEAAGAAPATVTVHPWIYHLRGLLYAEHGHQHHDINRTPELFDPAGLERGGPLAVPLGTHIADYRLELEQTLHDGGPAPTGPRRLLAAGRSTARFAGPATDAALRAWLAARGGPSRPSLTALADNLALPPEALREIASICPTGPRDLLTRALRRPAPDPMRVTAAHIDQILSRRGRGARFYIFGHTHRAAHTPLGSGASEALYLNPGTWSVLRPTFAAPQLTFLELTLDGRAPYARLMRWGHAEGRPRPVGREGGSSQWL
jgi:UDP-2,3-diacylglucosamine pyrophosphatase LpxH